uniref:ATP-grasp domain-containing protein n=1 Tax=Percolomonas cosmopolitus TaxID=63605 RepID=A0A7S1KU23_9EUKA
MSPSTQRQKASNLNHYHKRIGLTYWDPSSSFHTIIVVPSQNLDSDLNKVPGASHYEERLLFNLILLREPKYRIIYVTSMPIDQSIIEYYWDLISAGTDSVSQSHSTQKFADVKSRLFLFNCLDDRPTTLTRKILSRPKLVKRIKAVIQNQNKDEACMSVYIASPLEQQLADKLGVTLLAGHVERHQYFGSKFGCKTLFTKVGIPTPPFTAQAFSVDQLAREIEKLIEQYPEAQKLVVKLNEGFSGQGNAILDVEQLRQDMGMIPREGGSSAVEQNELSTVIKEYLPQMRFQGNQGHMSWENYKAKIEENGALAELWVESTEEPACPSCQAICDSTGDVQILSTHEQQLGGADNQQYVGCLFPASTAYRNKITEYTQTIGEYLEQQGIVGHFGVDYMIFKDDKSPQGWNITAIELNLRILGTTHPNMLCNLLTSSNYDTQKGISITRDTHEEKCYVASDNIHMKEVAGLLPQDLREYETCEGSLHFCPKTRTGVVFHLLGTSSEIGKIGATAIANSTQEAQDLYERFLKHFQEFAGRT